MHTIFFTILYFRVFLFGKKKKMINWVRKLISEVSMRLSRDFYLYQLKMKRHQQRTKKKRRKKPHSNEKIVGEPNNRLINVQQ